jgi:hypothetical protein
LRPGLESSNAGPEASLGLLAPDVHLLLGLARQVIVLGGRVILPRFLNVVGHLVKDDELASAGIVESRQWKTR